MDNLKEIVSPDKPAFELISESAVQLADALIAEEERTRKGNTLCNHHPVQEAFGPLKCRNCGKKLDVQNGQLIEIP